MKKDLFKELGMAAEKAILSQEEMICVEGGSSILDHIVIDFKNGFRCILDHDNIGYCPGNVCDPTNLGACAGNTVGGGPRTCPLSL